MMKKTQIIVSILLLAAVGIFLWLYYRKSIKIENVNFDTKEFDYSMRAFGKNTKGHYQFNNLGVGDRAIGIGSTWFHIGDGETDNKTYLAISDTSDPAATFIKNYSAKTIDWNTQKIS